MLNSMFFGKLQSSRLYAATKFQVDIDAKGTSNVKLKLFFPLLKLIFNYLIILHFPDPIYLKRMDSPVLKNHHHSLC